MPLTSKLLVVGGVAIAALAMTARYGNVDWRGTAAPAKAGASTNRLGYLSPKELPDSITLLPPPPAPGSSAMQADEAARTAALPLRGTARYRLAALEAPRTQANTVDAFLCAFGTDISTQGTPKLVELLSRVRLDVRAATYPAKSRFKRPRPFVVHNSGTCYPADEAMERGDGSYPSARGAVGWAFALVLADLRPDRADEILKRGRDFGQSRVICDQEWASDIEAGRTIAAVMIGRLESNAVYASDLAVARKEVADELAKGIKPAKNCQLETLALAAR